MLELSEHVKQLFELSDGVRVSMLVKVDEFWSKVSNLKCEAGMVLFSVLPEQMFSRLKLTTDKFRSKPLNSVPSVNLKLIPLVML